MIALVILAYIVIAFVVGAHKWRRAVWRMDGTRRNIAFFQADEGCVAFFTGIFWPVALTVYPAGQSFMNTPPRKVRKAVSAADNKLADREAYIKELERELQIAPTPSGKSVA